MGTETSKVIAFSHEEGAHTHNVPRLSIEARTPLEEKVVNGYQPSSVLQ